MNILDEQFEDALYLPVRMHTILRRAGIRTVRQLTEMTPDELRLLPGVGSTLFDATVKALAEYRLTLSDRPRERTPDRLGKVLAEVLGMAEEMESIARRLRRLQY